MIIRKYGIELHRLTEQDLELVRQHRNSEFIRTKMFYQKEISKEEQQDWFTKINNDFNYYFLIVHAGKKVGLVHGKIDSYDERIAQGGLFIWDRNALNSHIPVIASVCTTDLTFFIMGMNVTTAEVRMDNQTAIDYNLSLGYSITETNEDEGKILMSLVKEDYLQKAEKIRTTVKRMAKDSTNLTWDNVHFPKETPDGLYQKLPDYLAGKVHQKLQEANDSAKIQS